MGKITKIKTDKDYAVIHFTEFDSYSEIPTNWLCYEKKFKDHLACKWPHSGVKNISPLIKNRTSPAKDWTLHEIEIFRYCSSLESARKAAEDSQYSSAPENLGRGHRRRTVRSPVRNVLKTSRKNTLVSSSSSDDDNEKTESALRLPQFPTKPTVDSSSKVNNPKKLSGTYSEIEDSDDSVNLSINRANALINSVRSNKRNEDSAVQVSDSEKIDVLTGKVDSCIYLLSKILTEVQDLKQRTGSTYHQGSGLDSAISAEVESHLKLDSRDGVKAFEERLKDCKKFEAEFIRKVKQVGGANGKDYTERVLTHIFSNKFAKENTWEGKLTKYKVNSLKVIEICEKAILDKFPTWDKAEFNKAGTNWFRLGNQRAGEQPKQVTRKSELNKNNQQLEEEN